MEAAEPSMTLSRRTCKDLASVWTQCMMLYGGQCEVYAYVNQGISWISSQLFAALSLVQKYF